MIRTLLLATCFFLFVGCNSDKQAWKEAQNLGTIEAYETFLKTYPSSKNRAVAEENLEKLWFTDVMEKETMESFKLFLSKFPNSPKKKIVERNIEVLVYKKAMKDTLEDGCDHYLKEYPDGNFKNDILVKKDDFLFKRLTKEVTKESFEKYKKESITKNSNWDLADLMLICLRSRNYNKKDKTGLTALHYSALNGHYHLAEWLIKKKANVKSYTNKKLKAPYGYTTALHFSAMQGHGDITTLLLAKGANVNSKDKNSNTPILLACQYGGAEDVALLQKNGASLRDQSRYGTTTLMFAVANNKVETVEYLLKEGVDINAESKKGETALTYAVLQNNRKIETLLINKGADVNKGLTEKQLGGTSNAKMVPVNGRLRMHYKNGFVDLARKPEELSGQKTFSRWEAVRQVPGSQSAWLIKAASPKDILESSFNPDARIGEKSSQSLCLAPGFRGKVFLEKGDSTVIFGKTYRADKKMTINLSWEKVVVK